MKPKTIKEYVDLIMERGVMVEHGLTNTTKEQEVEHWVTQIQQLLEECAPKKKTVKDDLASMTLQERYIDLKHEGYNQAVEDMKQLLDKIIKP